MIKKYLKCISHYKKNIISYGMTTIEWMLMGAFVSVISIVAITGIGTNANETFSAINNAIMSENSKPVEPPVEPPLEPLTGDATAILYRDYELVFQRNTTPESGRPVLATYSNFELVQSETGYAPWWGNSSNIKKVTFKEEIRPVSTKCWFGYMTNLEEINNIDKLNTVNATNLNSTFMNCSKLTFIDVSHFKTKNVTDMGNIFSGCRSLVTLDLKNFDTSKTENMNCMFQLCEKLETLNINSFDTSSAISMAGLFNGASSLKTLDLRHFDTSKIKSMEKMFYWCSSLTSLEISKFDTSSVANMSNMFYYCVALPSINVKKFDTSNVTNMDSMFGECDAITSLDIINFDTSKVTNMNKMFYSCDNLILLLLPVSPDISSSPAVKSGAETINKGISQMFLGSNKLKAADQIPAWYTGKNATI